MFYPGLTAHSQILANLFSIVEQGLIKVPLAPEVQEASQNLLYVQQFMANLLKTAFPHLQDNQIKVIIEGFVTLDQDISGFKEHLRDFLVQIREATGNDTADLYLEDREQTLKRAAEEKRKIQMSVPGMSQLFLKSNIFNSFFSFQVFLILMRFPRTCKIKQSIHSCLLSVRFF